MKLNSVVAITVLAISGYLFVPVDAFGAETFHNGGIGSCEGCHGRSNAGEAVASPSMLKGADASSTCLTCHEAPPAAGRLENHHIASNDAKLSPGEAPSQLTPGGDFGWLKKDYRWKGSEGKGEESSRGDTHGHNIVAGEYGFTADSRHPVAPGGSYPSQLLSCTSCHDPHGDYKRYADTVAVERGIAAGGSGSYATSPLPSDSKPVGTYRMLAGKGYVQKSSPAAAFVNDPPVAVAPVAYNRPETVSDTRVAYGRGMSEWCQNCHPNIHARAGGDSMGHPAGESARFTAEIVANYNSYLGSGNLNGSPATAYSSMVPFETGTDDYALLKGVANSNRANLKGADGESRVMCLSCHRAHASGWDSATRWNMQSEFIVHNGKFPGTDNYASAEHAQGRTSQEVRKSFYDREASVFASFQRSLCNKCHAKD